MENSNNSTQDCGPDCNCNVPKRNPKWLKYISLLVILAALSIVVIKVAQNNNKPVTRDAAIIPGKSCCSDTSKTSGCDTSKNSSCCPKSGN